MDSTNFGPNQPGLRLFHATYELKKNIPLEKFKERLKRYSDEGLVVADISIIRIEDTPDGYEINPSFPYGGRNVFPRIVIHFLPDSPGVTHLRFTFENSRIFKWMLRIAVLAVIFRLALNYFRDEAQTNRVLNNPLLDVAALVFVIAMLQFDFNNKVNAFVRFVDRLALLIEKEG